MEYLIIFIISIIGASVFLCPPEAALIVVANLENASKFEHYKLISWLIDNHVEGSLPLLVLIAAFGSSIGSSFHYFAGRASASLSERAKKGIEKINLTRLRKSGAGVIAVSAFISLPPYTLVSIASGFIRYPYFVYFAAGFVGKAGRYAVAAFAAESIGRFIFHRL